MEAAAARRYCKHQPRYNALRLAAQRQKLMYVCTDACSQQSCALLHNFSKAPAQQALASWLLPHTQCSVRRSITVAQSRVAFR